MNRNIKCLPELFFLSLIQTNHSSSPSHRHHSLSHCRRPCASVRSPTRKIKKRFSEPLSLCSESSIAICSDRVLVERKIGQQDGGKRFDSTQLAMRDSEFAKVIKMMFENTTDINEHEKCCGGRASEEISLVLAFFCSFRGCVCVRDVFRTLVHRLA